MISNETDLEESNCIDWLEKSIADEYFNYYEYSDFKNIFLIGKDAFGIVSRANWKDADAIFALQQIS